MSTCPLRADGVHDMTKSPICACGFELHIPRFGYTLSVHDNETNVEAVDDCFMTDDPRNIADALERAARKLRAMC